ncbi:MULTISPECIES: hypothetical protein [Eikenella]|uniref:hypothetical protein n=1 Tax=Eikenella TaxID=538 RepID=UPI0012E82AE1|nr:MULTISPECIES: hypothetical protein [Eikenella]
MLYQLSYLAAFEVRYYTSLSNLSQAFSAKYFNGLAKALFPRNIFQVACAGRMLFGAGPCRIRYMGWLMPPNRLRERR